MSSSSCCATSSRFCGVRWRGRSYVLLIAPCWQRQPFTCRARCATHGWSLHGRCFVGIGRSCDGSGGSRPGGAGGRGLRLRFWSGFCGSHARIRAGATGGSAASSVSSASRSRRQASGVCSLGRGWGRRRGARGRVGARFSAQAASIVACDFFTIETAFLRRYYVLIFIAHGSRRVWLAGCTRNPSGAWVTQQARNLALTSPSRASVS